MIESIPDPDDPRLADYRRVGDPEWLRAQDLFVAEGRLLVERLVAAGGYEIVSILLTPAAARVLVPTMGDVGARVFVVDPPLLQTLTGYNFHRGCLALARRPVALSIEDVPAIGCLLGLEGVGNPDNVGGLFRTAAAFGVTGIVLDRASGDPFYRKALRTSMGAVLTTSFARVQGAWLDVLTSLRERGIQILALTPRAGAVTLDEIAERLPPGRPRLLLVGSEGGGLSDASLAAADERVCIPIASDVDSLNVTVAAGIALSRLGLGGRRAAAGGSPR